MGIDRMYFPGYKKISFLSIAIRNYFGYTIVNSCNLTILKPNDGFSKSPKRICRGYGGIKGGSGGFGTRGQKSRNGSKLRIGFEGGQSSIYRRLPKLKGLSKVMKKIHNRYAIINIDDMKQYFMLLEIIT